MKKTALFLLVLCVLLTGCSKESSEPFRYELKEVFVLNDGKSVMLIDRKTGQTWRATSYPNLSKPIWELVPLDNRSEVKVTILNEKTKKEEPQTWNFASSPEENVLPTVVENEPKVAPPPPPPVVVNFK